MNSFDKTITLREKLAENNKDMLKATGFSLGLNGLSKLKKDKLVQVIVERILDPDLMYRRGAILTDKEISLFERGFDGAVSYSNDEAELLGTLNEMNLIFENNGTFVVPCYVADVWKIIKNEDFLKYHKRSSWVWKCLYWAEEMYGVTPLEIMLKVVNTKKGILFKESELINIFKLFPQDRLWSFFLGDKFLSYIYADNDGALEDLYYLQADKEFYIPTAAEVEEFYETGALLSINEYRNMQDVLIKDYDFSFDEARELLVDVWDSISNDDDLNGTVQWFLNQFELEDINQANRILSLFMPVVNNTRILSNRGHKPVEIHSKMNIGPQNMPVITAGSTMAAEMLRQAAPAIKKMGFGLDLESNADRVPVFGFPNGIDKGPMVAEKKVYPNDPCPCGSGKKYKKCCGRGW